MLQRALNTIYIKKKKRKEKEKKGQGLHTSSEKIRERVHVNACNSEIESKTRFRALT